jgi:HlyD family secretion protein
VTTGGTVQILSPIDGVVLRRFHESAAVVPVGERLLEVGDPSRLEVVADLLSTDAVRVMPGARVLLEQWGGGHALAGRVRRVEPSGFMRVSALGVEEQRVNVLIDFEQQSDAARLLGDGFRVEVRIVVWEQPSVLKVPVSALFRIGDAWGVFVEEEGRARVRQVPLGEMTATEAQVQQGLAEGQNVIAHPPDTLQDGTRIAPRPADAPTVPPAAGG